MEVCLLDTGPIVALLNRSEAAHQQVDRFFAGFHGQFVTTAAVITEAFYFISNLREGPAKLAEFLDQTDALIHDAFEQEQLRSAAELMYRYADMPMDFADATLVLAAQSVKTDRVLTLDRRGFSTYRLPSNKKFKLLLDR